MALHLFPRGQVQGILHLMLMVSKLYVINELGSTMSVFNVDENKDLRFFRLYRPPGRVIMENNYCADIHISNDGKFLYGSNRGENTIVTFNVGNDGLLKPGRSYNLRRRLAEELCDRSFRKIYPCR